MWQDTQWATYGKKMKGARILGSVPLHHSCEDCAKTRAEGPITQSPPGIPQ